MRSQFSNSTHSVVSHRRTSVRPLNRRAAKLRRALLAGAAALAATSWSHAPHDQVQAASATWTGSAGDGLWQTPTNWDNGVPGAIGTTTNADVATFSGSPAVDNVTVTLDANRNVAGITLNNNPGSTSSWVVGGAGPNGGNPLILTNGGMIQLANITPTIPFTDNVNAPLILAGPSYTFTNNATDLSNLGGFHFWGNIAPGSAAPLTTLTLDGAQGSSGSAGSEIIGVLS